MGPISPGRVLDTVHHVHGRPPEDGEPVDGIVLRDQLPEGVEMVGEVGAGYVQLIVDGCKGHVFL